MRAIELLQEAEASEFISDLTDLLVAAKANGLTEVNVEDIVEQLQAMGHSVTDDSLVNTLQGKEDHYDFIDVVTLNTIKLKSHVVDDDEGEDEEGDEEQPDAEQIATKSAMKGVKKDRKAAKQATKDVQL